MILNYAKTCFMQMFNVLYSVHFLKPRYYNLILQRQIVYMSYDSIFNPE